MAGENDFRRMLREDPDKLIASLTDGSLTPAGLTFAAEIAGQIPAEERRDRRSKSR